METSVYVIVAAAYLLLGAALLAGRLSILAMRLTNHPEAATHLTRVFARWTRYLRY